MKWICLNCGRKNQSGEVHCSKCGLDQETAMSTPITKKLHSCEECGHKHQEDFYCHVYVEGLGDENANEEDMGLVTESDSEKSESEESDDSSVARRKRRAAKNKKDEPKKGEKDTKKTTASTISLHKKLIDSRKIKPLETPPYIKAMGYVRCNCKTGIPGDSVRYEPLPKIVYVGKIQVNTFFEINDPHDRALYQENLRLRVGTEQMQEKLRLEKLNQTACCIPHILSFLPYGLCCFAPQVCTYWNYGTSLYTEYIDIRNCVPVALFRPHQSQVDSILVHGDKVYSGGDKRVVVSDLHTGQVLSLVTRDSGDLTCLFAKDSELFCCSSNGSVRSFGLTYSGQNLQMVSTMWDHTKAITDTMTSLPSQGICAMHGIEHHVCVLYTASADRSIKKCNFAKMQSIRTVQSPTLRTATFTRLAQSHRHVFAGTSQASIAVFNKDNQRCEREDIHSCRVPGYSDAYCLQITLKLPRRYLPSHNLPSVTGIVAPKIGPEFPTLWAGDATGQLTIWYIPDTGLDFAPAHTQKLHEGSITQMTQTWRHMVSIGADSKIILTDVLSFHRIRTIDVMEWSSYKHLLSNEHVLRKLMCVHVQENYDTGGMMVVGTSYGEVVVLPLGTTV